MLQATIYQTPIGPMSVLVDPTGHHDSRKGPRSGSVVAAGFCRPEDLISRLDDRRDNGPVRWNVVDDQPLTDQAVADYFGGDLNALRDVPVDQPGTVLQLEVWDRLRDVPAGSTVTYRQLAAATSSPRAVRAAGTACGRNLIAPFVPCHRALRSDGSLGGYLYGLPVKKWLLDHEGRKAAQA